MVRIIGYLTLYFKLCIILFKWVFSKIRNNRGYTMRYILIIFLFLVSVSLNAMTTEERDQVRQRWVNWAEALQDEEPNIDHIKEMMHSEGVSQGKVEVDNQECLICLDEKDKEYFNILECGHTFCTACLMHIVKSAIREKSKAQLRCPNRKCTAPMSEQDIKIIMNDNREAIDAIAAIRLQEWFASQSNAKYCPTPDCKFIFLSDERCPEPIACPQCNYKYCSNCLFPHAVRMTCREAEAGRIVDKESDEWKRINTRLCPNCRTHIEKNDGCSWVQCTNCNQGFCFNCYGNHHEGICRHTVVFHEQGLQAAPMEANPYAVEQDEMLRCEQVMRELQVRQAANFARRHVSRVDKAAQHGYVYYRDQRGPRQLPASQFQVVQRRLEAQIPHDRAYMWVKLIKDDTKLKNEMYEIIVCLPRETNDDVYADFIRVLNQLCHVHKKTDWGIDWGIKRFWYPRRIGYRTTINPEVFQGLLDQVNQRVF